jgi:hypothetical protein
MGIGAAFATGLVKGFTQNIQEEKARRLAEQQKIDAFQELALKSFLTGDVKKEKYNLVSSAIKSAQTKIDNREDIDIFGRATDGINVDFSSIQTAIEDAGDFGTIPIGTYNLTMSESLGSRWEKDRSDIAKAANITVQALGEATATPDQKREFESNFTGNQDNMNALRATFVSSTNAYLAELRKNNTAPINARDYIPNYEYFSNLLGLGVDQQMNAEISAIKAADVAAINATATPENQVTANSLVAVSSSLFPTSAVRGGFQTVNVGMFADNGIDIGLVDYVAKAQGRTTDVFLTNFSSQFNNMSDFMSGLGHATKIADMAKSGNRIDFTNMQSLTAVGDYLDKNVQDSDTQRKIIQGIQGPILTINQREMIARGSANIDDFKIGTSIDTGFKAVYGEGTSFADFKTRVNSARVAKEQLVIYKDLVENKITTVKGTILDSAAKFVDAFVGETGTVDQVFAIIGQPRDDRERALIETRLKNLKGGARARRDTLAFIIAANMARAEDQGGRLSDGDIQRNLDKLAPGMTTKIGEAGSIDTVIDTVDSLLNMLSETEAMIEIDGTTGFSVDLQERVRAVKTRDLSLKASRLQSAEQSSAPALTFEQASTFRTAPYYKSKNPAHIIKIDPGGTGGIVIIDSQGIVAQGRPDDLQQYYTKTSTSQQNSAAGTNQQDQAAGTGQPATAPAGTVQPAPAVSPAVTNETVIDALSLGSNENPVPVSGGFQIPGREGIYQKRKSPEGGDEYVLIQGQK